MLVFDNIVQYGFHDITIFAEFLSYRSIFSEVFFECIFDNGPLLVVACENNKAMFQVLPVSRCNLVLLFIPYSLLQYAVNDTGAILYDSVFKMILLLS